MTKRPKQMTIYFNAEDEALAKAMESTAQAHPIFNGNENKFVRYCIEYTLKNDKSLKRAA